MAIASFPPPGHFEVTAARSVLTKALSAALAFSAWGVAMPAAHARTTPPARLDVAACAVDEPVVLRAISPTLAGQAEGAQAIWLDGRQLRWPGVTVAEGQRVRLHRSSDGALSLDAGRLLGADPQGVVTLSVLPTGVKAGANSGMNVGANADANAGADADTAKAAARLPAGVDLRLPATGPAAMARAWHEGQVVIVLEDAEGRVIRWNRLQSALALDALYPEAAEADGLGVTVTSAGAALKLWAPTARQVSVCLHGDPRAPARERRVMGRSGDGGFFTEHLRGVKQGDYYRYLVDVFVPTVGWVRNAVTDPYSISLSADSRLSYVGDLASPALQPAGWARSRIPDRVTSPTDMVVYELHVRDFSLLDETVPIAQRGKYLAFTQPRSRGMRHLRELARAGLTDVHLLPIFDLASVPERDCVAPRIPDAAPDSDAQQAAMGAVRGKDCFNWGYDPWHYSAPEGSFASDADDGAVRVRELRRLVMGLHDAGLRVGMDVVYNHTTASGQDPRSVLDRIVPGYYQRLDVNGRVEMSTCCDNTATEHRMMGKLLIDSVVLWAREYKMASFRFDLMGHQPRDVMVRLQQRLRRELGRDVQLIGEGWNFGEVKDGERFVQASQLSLNGTGIGTFSDRGRDAVRGGAAGDDAATSRRRPGFIVPAPRGDAARVDEQRRQADQLRLAMAGTLRDFRFEQVDGERRRGAEMVYGDQPAGYASQPSEVVNYVENHDNQTLFDALVLKLPATTSREDRARTQALALAINALSQGVAYFHAGGELLRSKSMDRNSYDSGDWFNRLDWTGRDNGFGAGLPPAPDNTGDWPLLRPLLADPAIKPGAAEIDWTRRVFLDLLRIRASTPLLRLSDAGEITRRLRFHDTGPAQQPGLIVGRLDGQGRADAVFERLLYLVNVNEAPATVTLPDEAGVAWRLHPVQSGSKAADQRVAREATVSAGQGRFVVPARSAAVFVVPR